MDDRVLQWGAHGIEGGEAEAEARAPSAGGADGGEVGVGRRDAGGEGAAGGDAGAGGAVSRAGGSPVEAEPDVEARPEIVPVSVKEFHSAGLLWLANRALHPFGYALSIQVVLEDGSAPNYHDPVVVEEAGIRVVRTTDPLGLVFDEASEDECRGRFFAWLAGRNFEPAPPPPPESKPPG